MTYQVLARKWRPQTFEEVVGQEPITRTLKNALAQGRVAHAFLFSGPRGVGKTSVARILAKALNCTHGPTPTPCNACPQCREITSGAGLDVLEIDGASNRGIDEVRDLREKIKYAPAAGKYKVYIIDEVHMLTKEAFNALLKTLEEPPPHAVFVLATTEPHKVPATILSRCQRYDFRRLPTGAIQEYLATLAAREGWEIEPEGLALIAREAEGSLRDAQGFLDQVVTFGGTRVGAQEIARILGVTERRALLSALEAVLHRDGLAALTLVEELYNQGHDLKRFYQDLVGYARHLLLAGMHPEARNLAPVADSEWQELTRLARQVPAVQLHNLLSVLLEGEEELRRAPQPRLALEVLLLRLIHLEPLTPVAEWLTRLEALEQRLTAGEAAPTQAEAAARPRQPDRRAAAPAPADPGEDLETTWRTFLAYVKKREDGPLYAKLTRLRPQRREGGRLWLAADRPLTFVGPRQESRFRELVRGFFGPDLELAVEAAEKPTADPAPAPAGPPAAVDFATLKQHALDIFGGTWEIRRGKEDSE
ncbi:MAG: DNA polymerase III subunit gamma/tau [Syntrophobacterales bacterium]|nr:DNA polymerase III subunit gamma/tau [Syntrophobacterales bacterium]